MLCLPVMNGGTEREGGSKFVLFSLSVQLFSLPLKGVIRCWRAVGRSGCCVVLCRAGAAGGPSITPSFF